MRSARCRRARTRRWLQSCARSTASTTILTRRSESSYAHSQALCWRCHVSVHRLREKNKDALHPDITGVMQSSSLEFVSGLFADPAGAAGGAAAAPSAASAATPGKRKKGKGGKGGKSTDRMTVASQFMLQLTSLMRTINETDVHYVRCIKPNTSNKPAIFEMSHSALQLRCAGVLEAVRISRMAYPNRMPHAAFVRRYHLLASTKWQNDHPSAVSTTPGRSGRRRSSFHLRQATSGCGRGLDALSARSYKGLLPRVLVGGARIATIGRSRRLRCCTPKAYERRSGFSEV